MLYHLAVRILNVYFGVTNHGLDAVVLVAHLLFTLDMIAVSYELLLILVATCASRVCNSSSVCIRQYLIQSLRKTLTTICCLLSFLRCMELTMRNIWIMSNLVWLTWWSTYRIWFLHHHLAVFPRWFGLSHKLPLLISNSWLDIILILII